MIRIYADSTNDLSPDYIREHDITIIPLYVTMGERTGKDGVDFTAGEIFEWSEKNRTVPTTAVFSPADVEDYLKEAMEAGDDVVFVGISSDFSSACQAVHIATADLEYDDHVVVVDSRSLSSGIGLVIMEAVRMRDEGANIRQIDTAMRELAPKIRASFVVDTLEYLHRGGRCSSVTALFAGTLKIKPKIVVEDGKMQVAQRYRGSLHAVIMRYVHEMEQELKEAKPDAVYITHSGVDPRIVDDVREYLESLSRFREIIETRAGGIISCHCGPGTLGVLFISGKQ